MSIYYLLYIDLIFFVAISNIYGCQCRAFYCFDILTYLPCCIFQSEKGTPTVAGKSKSESKDKEKKHRKHKDKDREKDREHKKHKHRHKDRSKDKDKEKKRDKSSHHDSGAESSKKHHEKVSH